MFLPKQKQYFQSCIKVAGLNIQDFDFVISNTLLITHRSTDFYYKIQSRSIGHDINRKEVTNLFISCTPYISNDLIVPNREKTYIHTDKWSLVTASFETWVNLIKDVREEEDILEAAEEVIDQTSSPVATGLDEPNPPSPLSALHPIIQEAAAHLFANHHYRQAILDAYIALDNAVSEKAQRPDLNGAALMDKVFSPKNSILKVSENEDERLGFLLLFKGAIVGIRNPKAHSLTGQNDAQRTLEWLSFASVLLRKLDEAELVTALTSSAQ